MEALIGQKLRLFILFLLEITMMMQRLCQAAGVLLVLVPSIKRSHMSGVARWLNPHKALIQL